MYSGVTAQLALVFKSLCSGLTQTLQFLHRLRLFGVSEDIMMTFSKTILVSIIRYSLVAWFGILSIHLKSTVRNVEKTDIKVCERRECPPSRVHTV